jgi:hypothetical protein
MNRLRRSYQPGVPEGTLNLGLGQKEPRMKTYRSERTGASPAEQSQLHIARRTMTRRTLVMPNRGGGDPAAADLSAACLHSGAGLVRTPLPEASRPGEPLPIWLAVLFATSCEAQRNGENHAVRWNWVSGRALYTNAGRDAEHIEPLGVNLMGGHTMAVYWMPGETAYTVEVYRQTELCA